MKMINKDDPLYYLLGDISKTLIKYIIAFSMHYNESSAPRYSRNPLSSFSGNTDSFQTSKKHSTSLNYSTQMTRKIKQEQSIQYDMN